MMYTITRGPSKLVTQRRTGPTQQIDNKINGFKHKPASFSAAGSQAPKLVFNGLNRKKLHSPPQPAVHAQAEGFTAAHEENVRFVFEAWQEVEQQLGGAGDSGTGLGPVQYSEKIPNPQLKDFVPIDLEEWWAQRFLANIANLS
ncbi:MAPK regulated corepressor interacting protein 2 isoform X1 [Denticeps clupeoides]|uniref:MAPK regulated corepressor interacting protein 2 n=1 Tax=Denticeps clupeoides TaxID=299321 RepID=A0AAY4CF57_9TELE|nr:MAPK regulated corepressor interacting protein 2 isoform X1 [Denticeps clupeoides]